MPQTESGGLNRRDGKSYFARILCVGHMFPAWLQAARKPVRSQGLGRFSIGF
jgi:hypothetical protein